MYATFYPSDDFLDFVKSAENAGKTGYDTKRDLWLPHPSPEGGLPTIAYGHKIRKDELDTLQRGVSELEATNLLKADLETAYLAVVAYVMVRIGDVDLTVKQTEMLVEFTFNLGSLRGFPKFTLAVVNENWDVVKKECVRSYTGAYGKKHELTRRNELFRQRFLVSR